MCHAWGWAKRSVYFGLLVCGLARGQHPPSITTGTVEFVPTDAEPTVAERFRQTPHNFTWEARRMTPVSTNFDVYDVTFPSPVKTPVEANNTVHCEYYQPTKPGPRPAVIVLHILGGDFPLSRVFCNALAQHGVAALFVKMPYYGPRRDPTSSARMVSTDPKATVEGLTQAVLDIRRATAWLSARPEVDDDQLGIFGISLGGITSSLAATNEPRLQNVCMLLAGGDVGRVAWESLEVRGIKDKWLAGGGTREQFVEIMKQIDPVTYAANAKGKRILMLNADRDEVIPKVCTEALWKALGEPEIHYYRGGHYSVIRHIFSALNRVSLFFAANEGKAEVMLIPRAKKPPLIDAQLDDWQDGLVVSVDRLRGPAGERTEPPPMTARVAWDDEHLYLGFAVRDRVASDAGSTNLLEGRAKFLLSLGSPTEFWQLSYSDQSLLVARACRVPAQAVWPEGGQPTANLIAVDEERTIRDDNQRRLAGVSRANVSSIGSVPTPSVIRGELRIPWSELGLPPTRRRTDGRYELAGLELRLIAVAHYPDDPADKTGPALSYLTNCSSSPASAGPATNYLDSAEFVGIRRTLTLSCRGRILGSEKSDMPTARCICFVAVTVLAATAFAQETRPQAIAPREVMPLFNGRDLTGLTTWHKETQRADPRKVFRVTDGMIHLTGDGNGYIATEKEYRDYHLTVEYKWGQKTDGGKYVRNSGVLLHATGPDGGAGGAWPSCIECQLAQGCAGDIIVIRGKDEKGEMIPVRVSSETELAPDGRRHRWKAGGELLTFPPARGQLWWSRHDWDFKELLDTRGKEDLESPLGEWTRVECIADGSKLTIKINGVAVNHCTEVFPAAGRILLQTEGHEIYFRKFEIRPITGGK